jgi:hypothetical protein
MIFRVRAFNKIQKAWTNDGIIWKVQDKDGIITECFKEDLENAEIFNPKKSLIFDKLQSNKSQRS